MKIELAYGEDQTITLEVSEEKVEGILELDIPEGPVEKEVLSNAISSPQGAPHITKFLQGAKDVIFIVNDSTRPTPTARILESLLPSVPSDITKKFIVACGSHRPPTTEEYRTLLGPAVVEDKTNILLYHDAKDVSGLTKVGTTPAGEDVIINSNVANADRVVIISSIEPHYFAGFTGGRKSFLPGVAAYEIIERNHSHALDRSACTMTLKGNPVHEGMDAFARVAAGDKTYGVMTVVDQHGQVAGAAVGDLFQSFGSCVEIATNMYAVPMDKKAGVVVTVAPHPMDINLYQSQKALENGKLALAENGILILVSSCPDGIGPSNFYELLKSAPDPSALLKKISCCYKLGFHKAAKLSEIQTIGKIWAYTEMEDGLLEAISIQPINDIQKAVDEALEITGGKLAVLPDGSVTVPLVKGSTVCRS